MINSNAIIDRKKARIFKDVYSILIIGYIFTTYMPFLPEIVQQFCLYLLVVYSAVYITLDIKNYKINSYTKWFIIMILLSVISFFYAKRPADTFRSVELMLKILILAVAFSSYIESYEDFLKLFKTFSFSATLLMIILLVTGNLEEGRLGTDLYGNANSFAFYMMLSAMCSLFLFIYYKNKTRYIYLVCLIFILLALLLSGGRKYFIMPLIFLYFYFFAVNIRHVDKIIKYTLLFALIALLILLLLFYVPFLYENIGYRFEGLLNIFLNSNEVDSSTLKRIDMIKKGLEYFTQSPIIGYGMDNYKILYGIDTGRVVYSHNNFIELLVNLGAIGFIAYYGFMIFLLAQLVKLKHDKNSIKNFFIAVILCFFVFDLGAVTYSLYFFHVFIALASAYVLLSLKAKKNGESNNKQIKL